MNKTLILLWTSDMFLLTGFGLMNPILAIFIKDSVLGGSIYNVGIASAIFFIIKAIIQIPFSKYMDKHNDRKKWLLAGTFLFIIVPIMYAFSTTILTVFIAQAIYGVAAAIAASAWLTIWSRHLDKNHEGYEWSVYAATTGLGVGIAALIGGLVAEFLGFEYTFIFVAIMAAAGFFALAKLDIKDDESSVTSAHYHRKRKIHETH